MIKSVAQVAFRGMEEPDSSSAPTPDTSHKIQLSLEQLEMDLNRVKTLFQERKRSPVPAGAVDGNEDRKLFSSSPGSNVRRRQAGVHGQRVTPSPRLTFEEDDIARAKRSGAKHRTTTLAVISLDTPMGTDNEADLSPKAKQKFHHDTTYKQLHADFALESQPNSVSVSQQNLKQDKDARDGNQEEENEYCCIWPLSLLKDRPIFRLFLIMFINGILSLICAALIMEIELPQQRLRMQQRKELQDRVSKLYNNLTETIRSVGTDAYSMDEAAKLLDDYSEAVPEVNKVPQEIEWNILSAQAFITSVQTTTGYGDIIPVTFWGKLFTLAYSVIGIPLFMWYIFKLGVFFRLIVMKVVFWILLVCCPFSCDPAKDGSHSDSTVIISQDKSSSKEEVGKEPVEHLHNQQYRRRSTLTRMKLLELSSRLKQQYYDDKRFHPSAIGIILLIFLCSAALFVSNMEGFSYFDSFYACFITYSTIGFGDIDIFRISYRSNWFNLLIYGNFIHIAGYMILSAWVSSLLEKCGVRKF